MIVTVGRVGRAHGIKGEVTVEVRTDTPELRFAAGTSLVTDPPGAGPLTIQTGRWHQDRLLVRFAGVADRTAAELLRGVVLLAEIGDDEDTGDPEEFFDHQLIGLRVVTLDGVDLGFVREVIHAPGHDLLAVRGDGSGAPERPEILIPFVTEIVPEIDVAAGRVVVDPPRGLLDLTEADSDADTAANRDPDSDSAGPGEA